MINFLKDRKNLVIILLGLLFAIKGTQEGFRFAIWVISGVLLCSILDLLINHLSLKRAIFPNSAIISGFIVSGILDYRQPWFILVIFSTLAILSKHIIRFKHRHIFNPANFSLFMATLFKIPLTWNIESNVFLIIIFGLYFAYAYRKFPQILGFLSIFISLFIISGIKPFGIISLFFLFIMLIEPKTSGYGMFKGFIFGSIAGITSFLTFRFMPRYDIFVSSLFLANLFNPALKKYLHASNDISKELKGV